MESKSNITPFTLNTNYNRLLCNFYKNYLLIVIKPFPLGNVFAQSNCHSTITNTNNKSGKISIGLESYQTTMSGGRQEVNTMSKLCTTEISDSSKSVTAEDVLEA